MSEERNISYNKDKRIIELHDVIDKYSVSKLNSILIDIITTDDKEEEMKKNYTRNPIHLYINSEGGSVYDVWSIISIISSSKTKVYTYCTGYALSAGFILFLAGEKRFIGEYATLLYHQISSGVSGTVSEISEYARDIYLEQSNMEKYVLSKTKFSQEQLDKIRVEKTDRYINVSEALEYECATDIY